MYNVNELQQDLDSLPEEAQVLLVDFIKGLKVRYSKIQAELSVQTNSPYEQFKASGFIGCVAIEEDLSMTYKQVLSEKWSMKHDHR